MYLMRKTLVLIYNNVMDANVILVAAIFLSKISEYKFHTTKTAANVKHHIIIFSVSLRI